MVSPELARQFFAARRDAILADWFELLRLPTVGNDPTRLGDCARGTAWLRRFLRPLGFDVEICLTAGNPVLLAERAGRPGAPMVLFYGHYDVQPADPLDAWQTPPFEPSLRDGRVYARGAQDDKGQIMAFLQGVAALVAAGVALPPLKLALEGQEESTSAGLLAGLPAWRRRLQADILMVADSLMHASGRPAIVLGLRGVVQMTVTVRGATADLHSGVHGGVAPNPAAGLVRMIASLHDAEGRIAVPGYLDRVTPPTPEERTLLHAAPFDAAAYERATGVAPVGGEPGLPELERLGFRPTIEVNGIHSGYGGPGGKTVIPAAALAKLSARVCADQSPRECCDLIMAHLRAHCPRGLTVAFTDITVGTPALRVPAAAPVVRLAQEVLTRLDPRGPVFTWSGASVPVVGALRDVSGASPLLVGFGREEDAIHAPNESFSLEQFQLGMAYTAMMLDALAGNA